MSSKHSEEPVIIVGGGIAGLALARTLTETHIPFRLFERRPKDSDIGLALNLPGNAIRALSMLGLRNQIESVGRPLCRREYRTAHDQILFQVDEDKFWGPALRPRSVRRAELLSMLADGLPQECVSYGTSLSGIEPHATHPRILLEDGTRISGPLIVGADGVRSIVRREIYGNEPGTGLATIANASWRFMAPNPGVDCWTVWASATGMVLLMPVGDDEVYGWAAVTSSKLPQDKFESLRTLAHDFPTRVSEVLSYTLADPKRLYYSPLDEVRLDRWHEKRSVLIGDAAHATAPVWAEGAALGMEDAIVLGRLLAAPTEVPATLAKFEAIRRPRIEHVQARTDAISKIARLPLFIRNRLLPFTGARSYRQTYGPLREPI